MSDVLPPPSSEVIAVPVVATPIGFDTPCVHCGYNLRGLVQDMRCPECGTPVGYSFHGKLLRFADPGWLRRLQLGTTLKLWNILFLILLAFASVVMQYVSQIAASALAIVGVGLGLVASFLITSPEPNLGENDEGLSLRRLIRGCAFATAVGACLHQVAAFGGVLTPGGQFATPQLGVMSLFVVGSLLQFAGIIQMFGEFVFYRRFARRIPSPQLERSTTVVMWGTVITWAALMLFMVVTAVIVAYTAYAATTTTGTTAPPIAPAAAGVMIGASFVACFAMVGALVFGIWYLILLFRYREAFIFAAIGRALSFGAG